MSVFIGLPEWVRGKMHFNWKKAGLSDKEPFDSDKWKIDKKTTSLCLEGIKGELAEYLRDATVFLP